MRSGRPPRRPTADDPFRHGVGPFEVVEGGPGTVLDLEQRCHQIRRKSDAGFQRRRQRAAPRWHGNDLGGLTAGLAQQGAHASTVRPAPLGRKT